ncbi:MAG: transposase [Gammaproteobacteria bacterium]
MDAAKDGLGVEVHYRKISCCPEHYPCPDCGKRGKRKQRLERKVRSIAYGKIVYLDIEYAEYRARCGCCKTFRSTPPGVELGHHYDHRVRQAVLDRLIEDGMSVQKLLAALQRDFLLDLSEGFVYDCLHREVARLDMAEYRRWALQHFRGTLCVDELHLGRYTLLLATDPLGDFPVAFALVDANDQDHLRRFLKNLKTWGFSPAVVVTDGSPLYPAVLAELWPEARHQLCIFHVMQDISGCVLDAVKRMRREMSRRGKRGRKRKRGRPKKGRRKNISLTLGQKAHFILKHRHLIVKRRENQSEAEREAWATMLAYLPALSTLRTFMDKVYDLFSVDQTRQQAGCRRSALVRTPSFQAIPELARAIEMLSPEKFEKMMAFLHSAAGQQVRTNNHVERANRKLRYFEKVRYKWRQRRSIVRFLLVSLQRWRNEHPNRPLDTPSRNPTNKAKPLTNNTYALSG